MSQMSCKSIQISSEFTLSQIKIIKKLLKHNNYISLLIQKGCPKKEKSHPIL